MDHTTRYGMMKITLRPTPKVDGVYDRKLTGSEVNIYGYYVFTDDAVNGIIEQIQRICPANDDTVYTVFIDGRAIVSFINKDERLTIKNGEFDYED